MPNVVEVLDLIEQLETSNILVHQSRCVTVRNRNATCQKCVNACVVDCISVERNEINIDLQTCVGCGTCASVCPTDALVPENPTNEALTASCSSIAQETQNTCIIACKPVLSKVQGVIDPEKITATVCLGRIDASILITLVAQGIDQVKLVSSDCSACTYAKGITSAQDMIENAKILLDALNIPSSLVISHKFPSYTKLEKTKGYDPDKRGFFSGIKGDATTAFMKTADYAVKSALKVKKDDKPRLTRVTNMGVLEKHAPEKRMAILDVIEEVDSISDADLETRLWGSIDIDPKTCISCRMCATFCPTEALEKYGSEDEDFGVVHTPAICVQCRCCEDICPDGALTVSNTVALRDIAEYKDFRFPMKNNPNAHQSMAKSFLAGKKR